jgi:hypothetical protein
LSHRRGGDIGGETFVHPATREGRARDQTLQRFTGKLAGRRHTRGRVLHAVPEVLVLRRVKGKETGTREGRRRQEWEEEVTFTFMNAMETAIK